MQFLIIGRDGTDEAALPRRLATRQAHMDLGKQLVRSGNMWYGAALWNDKDQMIGSMLVMDFPTEKELQAWLKQEPYMTGHVWEKLEIQKCNVREPWQFSHDESWFKVQKRT